MSGYHYDKACRMVCFHSEMMKALFRYLKVCRLSALAGPTPDLQEWIGLVCPEAIHTETGSTSGLSPCSQVPCKTQGIKWCVKNHTSWAGVILILSLADSHPEGLKRAAVCIRSLPVGLCSGRAWKIKTFLCFLVQYACFGNHEDSINTEPDSAALSRHFFRYNVP